jgi:hypothetical protein
MALGHVEYMMSFTKDYICVITIPGRDNMNNDCPLNHNYTKGRHGSNSQNRHSMVWHKFSLPGGHFLPLVPGAHDLSLFVYTHQSWHGVHTATTSLYIMQLAVSTLQYHTCTSNKLNCISCHMSSFCVSSIHFLVSIRQHFVTTPTHYVTMAYLRVLAS